MFTGADISGVERAPGAAFVYKMEYEVGCELSDRGMSHLRRLRKLKMLDLRSNAMARKTIIKIFVNICALRKCAICLDVLKQRIKIRAR